MKKSKAGERSRGTSFIGDYDLPAKGTKTNHLPGRGESVSQDNTETCVTLGVLFYRLRITDAKRYFNVKPKITSKAGARSRR